MDVAVGIAFILNDVGMVRFAPQYEHAMRVSPATGSFGPPQAVQGKVCVMAAIILKQKSEREPSAFGLDKV